MCFQIDKSWFLSTLKNVHISVLDPASSYMRNMSNASLTLYKALNVYILIFSFFPLQSTLLSSLSRHFRRGSPSSPASGILPSTQSKPPTPGSKASHEGQEPFIQLVQAFVRLVQR